METNSTLKSALAATLVTLLLLGWVAAASATPYAVVERGPRRPENSPSASHPPWRSQKAESRNRKNGAWKLKDDEKTCDNAEGESIS